MSENPILAEARAVDLAKIRQARRMTPWEKFAAGAELFEEASYWTLAGIANQHPGWDAETRNRELLRRLGIVDRIAS